MIHISIEKQNLSLSRKGEIIFSAPISSAKNGLGFAQGSYQTPTGKFIIREKIGHGAPLHTSFKGRRPTTIWTPESSNHDAILTRILWLHGTEKENANTYQRYIYLHGTHQENLIGSPASHGCIRLKNHDMLALYNLVPLGTEVLIEAESSTRDHLPEMS